MLVYTVFALYLLSHTLSPPPPLLLVRRRQLVIMSSATEVQVRRELEDTCRVDD
jgi:hypothetical protein